MCINRFVVGIVPHRWLFETLTTLRLETPVSSSELSWDFSVGVVFVKLQGANVGGAQNIQVKGYYDQANFNYHEQPTSMFPDRQERVPEQLIGVPEQLILGTHYRAEQAVSCSFSMLSSSSIVKSRQRIEGMTTGDGVRRNSSLLVVAVAINGARARISGKRRTNSGALGAAWLGLSPSFDLRETRKLFPHWFILLTIFLSPRTRAMLSGYHEWFPTYGAE
ncbi:hypothetical protein U1Q18_022942 [Sarracenia purpurea var. burkii]